MCVCAGRNYSLYVLSKFLIPLGGPLVAFSLVCVCLGQRYQGHKAPDSWTPRIIGAGKSTTERWQLNAMEHNDESLVEGKFKTLFFNRPSVRDKKNNKKRIQDSFKCV